MAISVADNFSYKGSKPLDARIQYATVANMKNATTSDLYDGCLAYVTETKKNYQYDSTNSVDPTTGKWRELQTGGGGGSSTFADLDDVDLNNLQNGQVPKWNSQTEKWENADAGGTGGGHVIEDEGTALTQRDTLNFVDFDLEDDDTNEKTVVQSHELTQEEFAEIFSTLPTMLDKSSLSVDSLNFSLSEKVIGTWIDGKPLYQKTIDFEGLPSNAQKQVSIANLSIDRVVYCGGYALNPTSHNMRPIVLASGSVNDQIRVGINQNNTVDLNTYTTWTGYSECYITIRYTKTSDSALSSGEKIVGQWIDGKAIYEKVFSTNINLPAPSTTSTSWINSGLSAVGIDSIISGSMIDSDGQYFIANFCKMNSNTNIGFYPLYYVGARTIVNVTLQYTKTTD